MERIKETKTEAAARAYAQGWLMATLLEPADPPAECEWTATWTLGHDSAREIIETARTHEKMIEGITAAGAKAAEHGLTRIANPFDRKWPGRFPGEDQRLTALYFIAWVRGHKQGIGGMVAHGPNGPMDNGDLSLPVDSDGPA